MSREIKFRAWIPSKKYMGKPWPLTKCAHYHEDDNPYDKFPHEAVFMQFTGLKDKNGVEIYEGDIVDLHQFLFDGSEVECESRGLIGYSGSSFTLSTITSKWVEEYTGYKAGQGEFPLSDFTPIEHLYGLHEESFTVIGNIHENADLLEKAP